ncbi:hypothetical protein DPMN_165145 [Dreissena polymorpha]|uniref:RanBP2-type domain-containing protein n=1 Tax=Dreissena polymorpha TaxID=45954 RepID=A0A9D4ISZ3_DREPO|nr:hypothetical protein DPMN_165145 [Dreissena polymorpha]
MSSKEGKWDCTACTYRNFIVSRKCIMCGTVRPSHVSADLENSEQDIYKVAELDATRNQDSSFCLGSDSLQVWLCKKCTFKNGIDKNKCVECLLPRDLEVEPVDSLKEEVKVQNSTSKPTLSLICPPNVTSKSVASDKILPKSPSMKGLIIAKLLKWPCKLCTFENHAKSLKCTMCLNPREYLASEEIKSPVIGSPGSSLMLHTTTENRCSHKKSGKHRCKYKKSGKHTFRAKLA